MKRIFLVNFLALFMFSSAHATESFKEAPLMSGGEITFHNDARLEKIVPSRYEDVVSFYDEAFKSHKHVKTWDRGSSIYIEDHSNRPWHSISISKLESGGSKIVISGDSWTWIIGTLMLRFIAVFLVLMVLYIATAVMGAVVSRIDRAHASR